MSFAQERHEAEQFAIWDHVRRCRLDLADAEKRLAKAERAPVTRWSTSNRELAEVDVTAAERTLLVAIRTAYAAGLVDEFGVDVVHGDTRRRALVAA